MFRHTPSGPTFTQTPLPCEPDPEDEPDWAGAVAEGVPAGADAGAYDVDRDSGEEQERDRPAGQHHDRHRAAGRMQPQDTGRPADAGPDPVGDQREGQLRRGQCPIRAVSRSLRSADRRCTAVMPSSR